MVVLGLEQHVLKIATTPCEHLADAGLTQISSQRVSGPLRQITRRGEHEPKGRVGSACEGSRRHSPRFRRSEDLLPLALDEPDAMFRSTVLSAVLGRRFVQPPAVHTLDSADVNALIRP
jgi:hypothetical protein